MTLLEREFSGGLEGRYVMFCTLFVYITCVRSLRMENRNSRFVRIYKIFNLNLLR